MLKKLLKRNDNKILKKYSDILSNIKSYDFSKSSTDELIGYMKNSNSKYEMIAVIYEAMKRTINIELYDEQLIGSLELLENKIVEMKTGEGKTYVIAVKNIIKYFEGDRKTFVATATDYLAKRDFERLKPLYDFFNIKTSYIIHETRIDNRDKLSELYDCDIVYSTYRGFLYDYLQSNLARTKDRYYQTNQDCIVIDEIDSILIDEATEAAYISDYVKSSLDHYREIIDIVRNELKEDQHFIIDREKNLIELTETGIERLEKMLDIDNLYSNENIRLVPIIEQSIRALYLIHNGKDYIVEDDSIVLLDEYGRKNISGKFAEGLQQACEAKENLELSPMIKPVSKMSYQSYFRLFKEKCGCSGTAKTEESEFKSIYNLDVVVIPTHKPIIRKDLPDVIYIDRDNKLNAVVNEILEYHENKQPVIAICADLNESRKLSDKLSEKNIEHNYLDGTNSIREGEIILKSGEIGKVTVVANMAGRGVDIKTSKEVDDIGGLVVLGLSRHNSRREDNQLRGRTGREGKPGITQFFISMDDRLIVDFGNKKIKDILLDLDLDEDKPIISRKISKMVDEAQLNVESIYREFREKSLEYDDVLDKQRSIVFNFRRELIFGELDYKDFLQKCKDTFMDNIIENVFLVNDLYDEDGNPIINSKIEFQRYFKNRYNIEFEIDRLDSSIFEDEEKFKEFITYIVNSIFKDKFSGFNDEMFIDVLQYIIIPIIDELWSDHIHTLDLLQTGISWRSMTMKDPVSEYKREAFQEFENLLYNLKLKTFESLLNIKISRKEE